MSRFIDTVPTADEVEAFVEKINEGRKVLGLSLIAKLDEQDENTIVLDFDSCVPSVGTTCLSATHLISEIGYYTGCEAFSRNDNQAEARVLQENAVAVMEAIGATPCHPHRTDLFTIPIEIRKVTDPFDFGVPGTREAFVEAGYIE